MQDIVLRPREPPDADSGVTCISRSKHTFLRGPEVQLGIDSYSVFLVPSGGSYAGHFVAVD
jgi:hypothetical protein